MRTMFFITIIICVCFSKETYLVKQFTGDLPVETLESIRKAYCSYLVNQGYNVTSYKSQNIALNEQTRQVSGIYKNSVEIGSFYKVDYIIDCNVSNYDKRTKSYILEITKIGIETGNEFPSIESIPFDKIKSVSKMKPSAFNISTMKMNDYNGTLIYIYTGCGIYTSDLTFKTLKNKPVTSVTGASIRFSNSFIINGNVILDIQKEKTEDSITIGDSIGVGIGVGAGFKFISANYSIISNYDKYDQLVYLTVIPSANSTRGCSIMPSGLLGYRLNDNRGSIIIGFNIGLGISI